ncbi:MAG: PulJ/GspJ family protein [Desulfohalobiaceae bacterium]
MTRPPRKLLPAAAGFTLIETVIALTVMALVVTILYAAFSTATRTWERQGRRTEPLQRHLQLVRLLSRDLLQSVPYTFSWERGKHSFVAGGPTTLFYVTKSGLGSPDRPGQGLFFTCLYLAGDAEEGQELFIYKRTVPEQELAEELSRFTAAGAGVETPFSPAESVREKSIRVLSELTDASFSFASEEFRPFAANAPPYEGDVSLLAETEEELPVLPLETWTQKELPGQILFSYRFQGRPFTLHVPVAKDAPPETGA